MLPVKKLFFGDLELSLPMPMVTFSHSAGDFVKNMFEMVSAISMPLCSLGLFLRSVMTEEAPRDRRFSMEPW